MAAPLISLDTLFSDGFDLYPTSPSGTSGDIPVTALPAVRVPTVGVTPHNDDLDEKDRIFQLLLRKYHGKDSR